MQQDCIGQSNSDCTKDTLYVQCALHMLVLLQLCTKPHCILQTERAA